MAQGWAAFERTCLEMGVGELPQLLQYVKTHTTPTPTATPVKEEQEKEPMDVGAVKTKEKPIHVSFRGQTVEYRCGNCDIAPKKSKAGMDAHIWSVHTKKALLCSFCTFSTYNLTHWTGTWRSTTRTFFVSLVGNVTVTTSMGVQSFLTNCCT